MLIQSLLLLALLQTEPTRTVLNGVYTAEQAARGEVVFTEKCKTCHRSEYLSSPEALALKGPLFVERWREDSLGALYTKMKGYMPPANVGPKLKDDEYLDLLAYFLQVNAYPTGSSELKIDQLADIQIVDHDGPKPLSNNTQVLVVGCLTPGSNDSWTLTNATEPIRTRTPEETTPQELTASDARPPGSLTFQLRGIENLPATFSLDSHKSQKVQAKGVLLRQASGNRLTLLSMAKVSSNCGS